MKKAIIIIVAVVVVLGLFVMGQYNSMVGLDEGVKKAWGEVENKLQRRFDLIGNLVNTVKGYAQHEKNVFEDIARLRSQWGEAKTAGDKIQASNQMDGALGRLMVVVENYPELKADKNFLSLQDELAGTENRISTERGRYNEAVNVYNTSVRRIPKSIFAGMFGFDREKPYFKAAEGAKDAPKVQF